ncbi:30S ribosomal protein S20 [Candidatus Giovannonibacteria bacterium RIFCSPLOWO2_01_FULL_44_40]|uniref:Small ribosomal subunit protein bS20 n=1 Tax=Candidatus Giovannonibacteria bacterium RIFCSPHIGHO2_01_FULL_45_23 TaxID=1798325 RepID=A0A1F5VFV2_9BACT|nr:MAG: 30S ribosomal protein S20 [Candidatus Giovannonibacteria bacterium RIFCSPHIGHO2_01_FULL_45_23]OGF75224.1 MAG: 30S ribosomal protein S20 [Candidatus Giovannonibacteria bacterium RIFCSPHIGHO2_02_FULL_45_13]OGF79810.1 MAG: 30S ribosomal protein S20 [Candidatus Giovannonibacteria bacterium RIFCSPLOWO2_01_FULL_44_40]
MPITSSAKKALRQSESRRVKNRAWKDKLKAAVKKAGVEKSPDALSAAYKIIDKSAKKGLIKKNKAARMKSRLAKLLSKSSQ